MQQKNMQEVEYFYSLRICYYAILFLIVSLLFSQNLKIKKDSYHFLTSLQKINNNKVSSDYITRFPKQKIFIIKIIMRSDTILLLLVLILCLSAAPVNLQKASDDQDTSPQSSNEQQPHLVFIFKKPETEEPSTQPTPSASPDPTPTTPSPSPSLFGSKDDSSVPYRYGSWRQNKNKQDPETQTYPSSSDNSPAPYDQPSFRHRGCRHHPWRRHYPMRFSVVTGGLLYIRHIRFVQLIPEPYDQTE